MTIESQASRHHLGRSEYSGCGLTEGSRETPSEEVKAFVSQLRVYAISDQDDSGPWIRGEFPDLSYIVSPSTPDGGRIEVRIQAIYLTQQINKTRKV